MTMLSLLLLTLVAQAGPLTYDEALQRALERNPELLGSDASRQAAQGALLAARSPFDPNLTASLGYAGSKSESTQEFGEVLSDFKNLSFDTSLSQAVSTGTTLSLGLSGSQSRFRYELRDTGFVVESDEPQWSTDLQASIRQNLLEGLSRSYNLQGVRQAARSLDQAELSLLASRQRVLADTASAYWSLYQAQRLVTIADQAVAVAEEERRIVLAKVDAGDLAPVERSRVEATLVQARSAQLSARNTAQSAAEALQLLVGAEPDGLVEAVTVPADPVDLDLDDEAIVAEALAKNPDLQAARQGEEGADLDLRDARHGRLPSLAAVGTYTLKGYETSFGGAMGELARADLHDWYLGGELSTPLGNRADRGSVAQKEAALAQARISRQALERSVEQSVRAQVRAVESARLGMELARANLDLAEQTLAAERALQDAGRALQKDVLEAIRTVDDARVAVEQARADHALAVVELMRLRGAL